jgi:FkbM family methyltransferase
MIVHRLSPFAYAARLARNALVRRLGHRRKRLRAARIACFPGDDIGDQIIAHGWYEDVLLEALFDRLLAAEADNFRAGIAVDVGANIGNHSLWFAARFARVLAFEPNPICIKLFEANVLMNDAGNVRLFPLGLSDAATQMTFHSNQGDNLGRSGVTGDLAATATHRFPVTLERGDDVLIDAVLGALPVALVKLDIEGHELPAIAGLRETLLRHRPLVLFECQQAGGAGDAIVAQLSQWGYCHFYVLEANASPYRNRLAKLCHRLFNGRTLAMREVTRPGDRRHSLVVASTRPQCAS